MPLVFLEEYEQKRESKVGLLARGNNSVLMFSSDAPRKDISVSSVFICWRSCWTSLGALQAPQIDRDFKLHQMAIDLLVGRVNFGGQSCCNGRSETGHGWQLEVQNLRFAGRLNKSQRAVYNSPREKL